MSLRAILRSSVAAVCIASVAAPSVNAAGPVAASRGSLDVRVAQAAEFSRLERLGLVIDGHADMLHEICLLHLLHTRNHMAKINVVGRVEEVSVERRHTETFQRLFQLRLHDIAGLRAIWVVIQRVRLHLRDDADLARERPVPYPRAEHIFGRAIGIRRIKGINAGSKSRVQDRKSFFPRRLAMQIIEAVFHPELDGAEYKFRVIHDVFLNSSSSLSDLARPS